LDFIVNQVDVFPDAVYWVDNNGTILWGNDLATAFFGFGDTLEGKPLREVLGRTRYELVWSVFEMQFVEGEEFQYIEFDSNPADGTPRWLAQRSRLVVRPGKPPLICAVLRDISSILSDRMLVSRSEEKYRGMIQNSSLGLLEVDPDEVILYANKAFCEITGYEPHELVGQKAVDLLLPRENDDYSRKMQEVQEQRSSGVANAYEIQIRRKDGELRWVLISGAPVYDGNGRFTGSIGIHHDITEQKKESLLRARLLRELDTQNATLQEQKEHLSAIYGFSSGLLNCNSVAEVYRLIVQSVRGKLGFVDCLVYHVNQRLEVVEFDPSYLKGIDPGFPGIVPMIRIPMGQGIVGAAALNGKLEWIPDTSAEPRYIRDRAFSYGEDGSLLIDMKNFSERASEMAVPILNQGEVLGVIDTGHPQAGYFRDIHQETLVTIASLAGVKIRQLRMASSLQESEARTRSIIDSALDAVMTVNPEGLITDVNRQATDIFNRSRNDLMGTFFNQLVCGRDRHLFDAMLSEFALRYQSFPENQRLEMEMISGQNETITAEISISSVVIQGDTFLSLFVRDITIRKRAEQELRTALAREAELSNMKTGFITMTSHEFRTPLTTIQSTSELMSMMLANQHYTGKEKVERYLDRIIGEVGRLTTLMNDILVLGRIDAGKIPFNPISLDALGFITEVIDGKHFLKSDDRVTGITHSGTPVALWADPALLSHVLTNLISNALKYSKGAPPPQVMLEFGSNILSIHIRDFGMGIPESEQKNLFQSFYRASNAENIQGTGLGLAIVKQFVDLHGGTVSVYSKEGEGSVFSVHLSYEPVKSKPVS